MITAVRNDNRSARLQRLVVSLAQTKLKTPIARIIEFNVHNSDKATGILEAAGQQIQFEYKGGRIKCARVRTDRSDAYLQAYAQFRTDKPCGDSFIPDEAQCTKKNTKNWAGKSARPSRQRAKGGLSKPAPTTPTQGKKPGGLKKTAGIAGLVAAGSVAAATAASASLVGVSHKVYNDTRRKYRAGFGESAVMAEGLAATVEVKQIRDQAHSIVFTSGGATEGGDEYGELTRSGTRMANAMRKMAKHKKGKDLAIIPVDNSRSNFKGERPKKFGGPEYHKKVFDLHYNNIVKEGRNLAAVDMAANVIAYGDQYPDRQLVMAGHSYGGMIVHEAEEIIRKARPEYEDRLKSISFGTQWGGMTKEFGKSVTVGSPNDKFTTVYPTRQLHSIDSVKGHNMGDYTDNDEVIQYVQDFIYEGVDVDKFKPNPPQKSQKSKRDRKAAREKARQRRAEGYLPSSEFAATQAKIEQRQRRIEQARKSLAHAKSRQQSAEYQAEIEQLQTKTAEDIRKFKQQHNLDGVSDAELAYLYGYHQLRQDGQRCGNSWIPDDANCTKPTRQGRQSQYKPVRISTRKKPQPNTSDNRSLTSKILTGLAIAAASGGISAIAVDSLTRKQTSQEIKQYQAKADQDYENRYKELQADYVKKTQELDRKAAANLKQTKSEMKTANKAALDKEKQKLQFRMEKQLQKDRNDIDQKHQAKLADEIVQAKLEARDLAEQEFEPKVRSGTLGRSGDEINLRASERQGLKLNLTGDPYGTGLSADKLKTRVRSFVNDTVKTQYQDTDIEMARDFRDHVQAFHKANEKRPELPAKVWDTFKADMGIQHNREAGLLNKRDEIRKKANQHHSDLVDQLYAKAQSDPEVSHAQLLKEFDAASREYMANMRREFQEERAAIARKQRFSTDRNDVYDVQDLRDVYPLPDAPDAYLVAYELTRADGKKCGDSYIPDDHECDPNANGGKGGSRKKKGLSNLQKTALVGLGGSAIAGGIVTAQGMRKKAQNKKRQKSWQEIERKQAEIEGKMAKLRAKGQKPGMSETEANEVNRIVDKGLANVKAGKNPDGSKPKRKKQSNNSFHADGCGCEECQPEEPTASPLYFTWQASYDLYRLDASPNCDPAVSKPCGEICIPKDHNCEIDDDGLGALSIRDLKDEAKRLSITNYSLMNKAELRNAIKTVNQGPGQQARLEKTLTRRREAREKQPLREVAKIVRRRRRYLGLTGIEAALASASAVTAISVYSLKEARNRYRGRFHESAEAAVSRGEGIEVDKLDRGTDFVTFAVDGFTHKSKADTGGRLATLLKEKDPEGFGSKKHHVIPISGPEFNEIKGAPNLKGPFKDAVENFQKSARVLETSVLEGRNPQAVELASQVYAYNKAYNAPGRDKRNNKKFVLIGDHAGGNVVNEAVEILDIIDGNEPPQRRVAANLRVVNLGTNSWGLTQPIAKTDPKKKTTGRTATIYSRDDAVFLFPKRRPQHVHAIKGSTAEDYLSNPQAMEIIKGVATTKNFGRQVRTKNPKLKGRQKAGRYTAKPDIPVRNPDDSRDPRNNTQSWLGKNPRERAQALKEYHDQIKRQNAEDLKLQSYLTASENYTRSLQEGN